MCLSWQYLLHVTIVHDAFNPPLIRCSHCFENSRSYHWNGLFPLNCREMEISILAWGNESYILIVNFKFRNYIGQSTTCGWDIRISFLRQVKWPKQVLFYLSSTITFLLKRILLVPRYIWYVRQLSGMKICS